MTIADKLALLEQTKEAQRVKLGLPKNLPFNQYIKFIRDPFTFADLFANGEQGVWIDPSDLTTMFQDVRGIGPVTEDGDPVGLILDKSQGLEGTVTNVAKPFIGDVSNEYVEVTNTSDGTKLVIKTLSNKSSLHIFEVGKTYKLTVVYSIPENSNNINVYNAASGVANFLFTATKGVRNKVEVTLTARNTPLYFRTNSGEVTIHEVVLKEIEGNHATQETASSRPIYRTDGKLHWSEFDGVDDTLTAQLPSGTYTEIKASRDGVIHKYPVNVNGSYTLGDLTQTKQSVSGLVLVNRQLTQAEIVNVTNLMKVKAGLPL